MNILLFPPIVFILVFIFVYIVFKTISPAQVIASDSKLKPAKDNSDYRKFFSYAAFFTVLHIAGLMLATWAFNPLAETIGPVMAYLISAIIILAVLFI